MYESENTKFDPGNKLTENQEMKTQANALFLFQLKALTEAWCASIFAGIFEEKE